jgi:hypothetical protein
VVRTGLLVMHHLLVELEDLHLYLLQPLLLVSASLAF